MKQEDYLIKESEFSAFLEKQQKQEIKVEQLKKEIDNRIEHLKQLPKHKDEQVNKVRQGEIFHLHKHKEIIDKVFKEVKK